MIDPNRFADMQLELAAEFAQYVADHPEFDEFIPEKAHVYFQIDGEVEFNQYVRELMESRRREDGAPAVLVRIKGLAQPQGSRLIEPMIEPTSAIA